MREGMARVVPVPLLSLFTGYELETMVCRPRKLLPWVCLCHGDTPDQCPSRTSVPSRTWKSEMCSGGSAPFWGGAGGQVACTSTQTHGACPLPAPPSQCTSEWRGQCRRLTVCPSTGVWQPRYPPAPFEVGGDVQRGGAVCAPGPVVLGGDGVLLQHRALPLPALRVGPHPAAQDHRGLPGQRLRHPGRLLLAGGGFLFFLGKRGKHPASLV